MYELMVPRQSLDRAYPITGGVEPDQLAAAHLEQYAEGLEPVQEGALVREGRMVRRYFYRVAHGYRYALPDSQEGAGTRE